ncbi:ABC transporter ATP-binding protein [Peribacillus cavernae]|uniref:ABC transporter ATP-binding protein n=1 Tax=Peribacillus cavernae TaxID=1674310 RepID=A0A3S0TY17_9BACI|nr:ABC transporter ATP-binding protein [Peribacillus cavernae]MDQ0221273.1 ATP-binding cassette subfamily B protein [Peribacillus cavernae]RUQ26978.1 ABC transporter ATP-binding protein [Peribacillus cavernae]
MRKLFRFVKPYKIPVIIVLVLTFLQSLSQLFLPTLMATIVDEGIVNGDIHLIIKIGGLMLLVAGSGVILSILTNFYSSRVAMGFGKTLRGKLFSHVENLSLMDFNKIGTSSLMMRTTNDILQVQQVLTMTLKIFITAPIMFLGGIIIVFSTDPKLSLIIIAALPFIVAAVFITAKKGLPLFKLVQKKLDRLNLVLREGLTGLRVIRSFNRLDFEKKRFNEANFDFSKTTIKVNKLMATLTPILTLVLNFSIIATIWFGSIRISNEHIQVGDLMAIIQYATQIMFSLIMASVMFVMIPRASVSAARINEVLDSCSSHEEEPLSGYTDSKRGQIDFRDVTFRYPGAEKPVISNLSFSAKPGEVTAIIGGTGAGKSTLINMIPRFYEIERGTISVDGINICDIPQKTLRSKIGLVPQKPLLFSGTIADNIRLGKESATNEEIKEAADIAQASDFITKMKDGMYSKVLQKGANLSGGQRQRLSIARALVRKSEIYIFDDSFSALDYGTQEKLQAALKKEMQGSTVLFITQRISSILHADQIIVLDEGRTAGIGTHEKLMKTSGIYREIVTSQLPGEAVM